MSSFEFEPSEESLEALLDMLSLEDLRILAEYFRVLAGKKDMEFEDNKTEIGEDVAFGTSDLAILVSAANRNAERRENQGQAKLLVELAEQINEAIFRKGESVDFQQKA